jgi:hypothetical protein
MDAVRGGMTYQEATRRFRVSSSTNLRWVRRLRESGSYAARTMGGKKPFVLAARGIAADLLHIDAGHDYDSLTNDLTQAWPVLRHSGVFVGDDDRPGTVAWQGVTRAVDDTLARTPHRDFTHAPPTCSAVKA